MPSPIKGKVEVLAYTAFSVVYAVVGDDDNTVLKGDAIWVDGVAYEGRRDAPPDGQALVREARIYELLGPDERITRCYGLETFEGTGQAWAVRLERAAAGNLRRYILKSAGSPEAMSVRVRMAHEFAQGVAHLHSRNVLWHDLSTRNALVFDGLHVKLCDFAGATVPGLYETRMQVYEVRYTPPASPMNWGAMAPLLHELFALGSAVYEITEWELPYGTSTTEEDAERSLARGTVRHSRLLSICARSCGSSPSIRKEPDSHTCQSTMADLCAACLH
ncbi:hypothetical protein VTK56DRAFT_8925 [Thermocarpiscus australiensis]